jgi:hypothetical protein
LVAATTAGSADGAGVAANVADAQVTAMTEAMAMSDFFTNILE